MWMFSGYGMGTAGWLLMGLFWIALLALVVFAMVRLFPTHAHDTINEPADRGDEPREILQRRLARGEIDVETYEQLSSKLGPPPPAGRG